MIMSIKTPTNINTSTTKALNFGYIRVRLTNGNLQLLARDTSDFASVPNITLQPATDYLIKIRQESDGQSGSTGVKYVVKVIRLDDNTEQDGEMLAWTAGENPDSGQYACYFSDASQHFFQQTGLLGPFILFEGISDASDLTCVNWIKGVYSDGTYVAPSGSNSSFAIEVDV